MTRHTNRDVIGKQIVAFAYLREDRSGPNIVKGVGGVHEYSRSFR